MLLTFFLFEMIILPEYVKDFFSSFYTKKKKKCVPGEVQGGTVSTL